MTLSEVSEFIVDSEHKTAPTQETGYPSIRTPDIGRGRLLLDGVQRVSEEVYKEWTRRAVPQEGDLIMAREAPVGNVGIVLEGMKVCLGQRTVLIRPDRDEVDPAYLTYLLLSREIQGRFHALSTGSTVPHLNLSDLRSFSLPELPPLPIQRRIAGILSAYDDLIENNARRIELLEEMAQAVYREWFVEMRFPGHAEAEMRETEVLGSVPADWQVAKLKESLRPARGQLTGRFNAKKVWAMDQWHAWSRWIRKVTSHRWQCFFADAKTCRRCNSPRYIDK